jgi:hypothetical protein
MENGHMTSGSQSVTRIARIRSLFASAIVIGYVFGALTHASAQTFTPPTTPTQITPEAGNSAFLVGHAVGSQGYTCLPTNTGGTSWTVNPPRPEATLFTDIFGQPVEIITHFASINEKPKDGNPPSLSGNATWQSSFDSSRVWAKATGSILAGSDPASCPNNGAIPCLLLQSIGNEKGPTGGRLLFNTTFVQRLNTNGGAAPTTACSVGQTQLVPYTADYYFYHLDQ